MKARIDEGDLNLAQVMLPIARLMNCMSADEIEDMHIEFDSVSEMGAEMFITCVRKYAWRHGIRINAEETALCFCLLQDIPLSDKQLKLLASVEDLLELIDIGDKGLYIGK